MLKRKMLWRARLPRMIFHSKRTMVLKCEYEENGKPCSRDITRRVAWFSLRVFGKELCMDHQKEERYKTMPKKMAEVMNNMVDRKYNQ